MTERCVAQPLEPLSMEQKLCMIRELVETYMPKLIRWLTRYAGGDRFLAEDAAQDAFEAVFRYFDKIRRPGKRLLQVIALNRLHSHLRAMSLPTVPLEESFNIGRPDDSLSLVELRLVIDDLMQRLSEPDRQAFQLLIADMEYQQIADTLQIPIGTVKSRLNRCRALARAYRKANAL